MDLSMESMRFLFLLFVVLAIVTGPLQVSYDSYNLVIPVGSTYTLRL
jgi:hypothetical protein